MADTLPGLPAGFVIDDTPPPQQVLSSGEGLPAGFALESLDPLTGATDTAARWATFGLADPVSAAGRAFVQKYGFGEDRPFSDLYQRNLAQQRGQAANFAAEHPYLNAAAATAGAITPTAPALGAADLAAAPLPGVSTRPLFGSPIATPSYASGNLTRQMATGAATGAGIGAAGGIANAQNTDPFDVLRDAGIGSLGGAVTGGIMPVGAALLSKPGAAVARRVLPNAVENQGAGLIASRIAQDQAAGGPAVSGLAMQLASSGSSPLAIADVGGANVQGLAGRFARMQGEPREIADNFLGDRLSGMAPRLIQNIDDNLASGNAFYAREALAAHQKAAAAPLYQAAYAHTPLNPDTIADGGQLAELMKRPAMRDAARNALKIAANEGRDPTSLGLTFNVAGDPVFEEVPSWQTLDYMKRGLDDVLNGYRDTTTGKLVLDEGGRAVNGTLKTFLNFLDSNNPPLAAARQAWAGDAAAQAAMAQGTNFRSMRPELTEQTLNGMSPSEQQFFRMGAADSLRGAVNSVGTATPLIGSNAVNQRGAQGMIDQIRPLFPSQDAFDRFVQNASNENLIFANTNKFIGNSATAGRLAEDTGHGHSSSALANLIAGVTALPREPVAAAGLIARGMALLNRTGETSNPAVNAAAARMLYNSDPGANLQTLASVMAQRPSIVPGVSAVGSSLAGSLYPKYELLPFESRKGPPAPPANGEAAQ